MFLAFTRAIDHFDRLILQVAPERLACRPVYFQDNQPSLEIEFHLLGRFRGMSKAYPRKHEVLMVILESHSGSAGFDTPCFWFSEFVSEGHFYGGVGVVLRADEGGCSSGNEDGLAVMPAFGEAF